MNDSDGQFTKEEYLAHIAKKQHDEMEELRANKPSFYARVIKGKKPSTFQLIIIGTIFFSGTISKYIPDIYKSLSEIGSPKILSEFDRGLVAYNSNDFATALKIWVPLAQQGHAVAQANLGAIYNNGKGVPQDHETAFKWMTLAAEQGQSDAQNSLSAMYYSGKGAPLDHVAAIKWATLAANQRNSDSQVLLGVMHSRGDGVPQNDIYAYMWLQIADSQANLRAGGLKKNVADRMSLAQLETAKKLAREWDEMNPY